MRELVYLSQRKLRQFDLGRSSWRGTRVTGEVKVPGFGGVSVGKDGAGEAVPDLDKVIAAIEGSDRAARWFTADLRPGQWVQFEAPMSYAVTEHGAVVFLDLDEPTPAYPTGGAVRLVLHGAREHLVGAPAREVSDRSINAALGYSSGNPRRFLSDWLLDLAAADDPRGQDAQLAVRRVEHKLPRYGEVIDALGRRMDLAATAAWVAGYARVTAVPQEVDGARVVVATPLYVEYVSEPG